MSKSVRYVRRGVQGTVRQNWGWPGSITAYSAVSITAAEVGGGVGIQTPPGAQGQDFHYHLGDASVWVSNVSPHGDQSNGGVEFLLHVDWNNPLDVAVTITVEDGFPIEVQGYGIH